MVEMKNHYAVVLTFSGEIAGMLSKLCEDYQQYINYTIVPHITLIYPFEPSFGLNRVTDKLAEVAKRTRPFTLVLNGIEFFERDNNVAYVAVENKQTVKELHVSLFQSLKGLVKGMVDYNLDKFVPHMTIGERIPEEMLLGVKQRFSDYRLCYKCPVTYFSLFSEDKGKWERAQVFRLVGGSGEKV